MCRHISSRLLLLLVLLTPLTVVTAVSAVSAEGTGAACQTIRPVHNAANWAAAMGPLRHLWNRWKSEEASQGRMWDDQGHLVNINATVVAAGSFRAETVPPSAVAYMVANGAAEGLLVAGDAATAQAMAEQEAERVRAANEAATAQGAGNGNGAGDGASNGDDTGNGDGAGNGDDDQGDIDSATGDPLGPTGSDPTNPAPDSEPVPTLDPAADLGDRANLVYGNDHNRQKLDLYLPAGHDPSSGKVPVIVFFHGGGFFRGDKGDVKMLLPLLDKGYAIASANYWLLKKGGGGGIDVLNDVAEIAKAAYDARKAVRWLRDKAGTYGLDANRFAAAGASAGGYLAAAVGSASNEQTLPNEGATGSASSAVKAVVDWSGPTNFATFVEHRTGSSPYPSGMATSFLNSRGAISPFDYVSAGDPPTMIRHGKKDTVVPYQQSTTYADALRSAGVTVDLKIYPSLGHEPSPEFLDAEIAAISAFLNKHMR